MRMWLPMAYKEDNPDLIRYNGYGELSSSYQIKPGKWTADVIVKKGTGWTKYGSIQSQLNWRPFKDENQYLMLQYFQGYGESLIDYTREVGMVRIGFVLKPDRLGIF